MMKWIVVFLMLSWIILDASAQRKSQEERDMELSEQNNDHLLEKYSYHKPYKHSFAIVRKENCKLGVVDRGITEAIPCEYDQIVQLGKELFKASKKDKVDYYWRGKVLPLGAHYGEVKDMGKNVMAVEVDKRWGLVTTEGKGLALMQYWVIEPFSEVEENYIKVKKAGKWGLLDYEGQSVLPVMYDDILPIYNGFAVKQDGQYEIITKATKGKPKVYYQNIKLLNNYGSKLAFEKDGLWGLLGIDSESEVITLLEPKYKEIKQVANSGIAIKVEGGWQLWDYSQEKLLKDVYTDVLVSPKDEILAVQKDGIWTLQNVNYNSNDPTEFVAVQRLADTYFRLETKEKVFFMNIKDNFRFISFEYEEVKYLGDHFFLVRKDGQEAVVNPKAEFVFEFSDQKIESYDQGIFKIRKDNKIVLLDRNGSTLNCE